MLLPFARDYRAIGLIPVPLILLFTDFQRSASEDNQKKRLLYTGSSKSMNEI